MGLCTWKGFSVCSGGQHATAAPRPRLRSASVGVKATSTPSSVSAGCRIAAPGLSGSTESFSWSMVLPDSAAQRLDERRSFRGRGLGHSAQVMFGWRRMRGSRRACVCFTSPSSFLPLKGTCYVFHRANYKIRIKTVCCKELNGSDLNLGLFVLVGVVITTGGEFTMFSPLPVYFPSKFSTPWNQSKPSKPLQVSF